MAVERGRGGGLGDVGPRWWHGGAAALAAAPPRPAVPGKRCLLAGEGQDGSQQDHPGAKGHHRPQAARRRRERAQPGKGGTRGWPAPRAARGRPVPPAGAGGDPYSAPGSPARSGGRGPTGRCPRSAVTAVL